MYTEHLIDVGRRAALERVGNFLLELLTRLQAIGLADERSYRMPLTQELIGDALGLSVPHVNRTLRKLREAGLVGIDGRDGRHQRRRGAGRARRLRKNLSEPVSHRR